jgi:hypothetical protein
MRNPLRSEAEAFRFLIVVIGVAAIIVGAAFINTWLGVAVTVVGVAGVAWWLMRAPSGEAPPPRIASDTPPGIQRILVVANETVGGTTLREEVARRAQGGSTELLVVAPALNSPVRHWVSDEDDARAAAQRRVEESIARLGETGLTVRGRVGDGDPLLAIEDALRTFGADEIVISTHPEGRSNWLERGVVSGARERFAVPITHVVVDLEAEGATR